MVPTAVEKLNTVQIVNHTKAVPTERPFLLWLCQILLLILALC
jgi:hypothetical protein